MRTGIRKSLLGLVLLAAMVTTPVTAFAQVPASIGSYVSYGFGTGVHTIAGTSAFPNFDKGAVNNHYPLAQVEQDASPASAARATFSDSGPAAATVGSQYNQSCSAGNPPPPPSACPNPNNGVPYANSNYPGGPASAHVDSCGGQANCPAAYADSSAAELQAIASGYYGGGGAQPFSGASSQSQTVVTSNGVLTVTTHSEVDNFSAGTVKISKVVVDTIATATNSSATADAHVVVGTITVNGQPVTLGDNGLTVPGTTAPCPSSPPTPAGPLPGGAPVPSPPVAGGSGGSGGVLPSPSTPTLPGASSSCVPSADVTYVQVFAVAPQKSVNGTHGVAQASGLHVLVTHPTPGAGVPQQSTEYVLGEGFADAQTGSGGAGGGFGDFGLGGLSGDFGFNGPSADNGGTGNPAANVAAAIFSNRWWPFVLLFLTLEALLFGSAAAWVWARNTPAEEVAEEVLSP
jgi:hypothetical protein